MTHTKGTLTAHAPDGECLDVIRIFADVDPGDALPVAICPQHKSPFMAVVAGETNKTTRAAYDSARIVETWNACAGVTGADGTIPPGTLRKLMQALLRFDAGDVTGARAIDDFREALRGLRITDETPPEVQHALRDAAERFLDEMADETPDQKGPSHG